MQNWLTLCTPLLTSCWLPALLPRILPPSMVSNFIPEGPAASCQDFCSPSQHPWAPGRMHSPVWSAGCDQAAERKNILPSVLRQVGRFNPLYVIKHVPLSSFLCIRRPSQRPAGSPLVYLIYCLLSLPVSFLAMIHFYEVNKASPGSACIWSNSHHIWSWKNRNMLEFVLILFVSPQSLVEKRSLIQVLLNSLPFILVLTNNKSYHFQLMTQ